MDAGDQVEGVGQDIEGDEPDHVGDLLVAVAKCPQFVDLALTPRTWYGMPAYAQDGKVVCFFQSAEKSKARYATFGFNDNANLDEGAMWPTPLRSRS